MNSRATHIPLSTTVIPPEAIPSGRSTLQGEALAAVNSFAVSLDQFETLHDMLSYALDRVLDVVGTEAGSVYMLNDAGDELDLVISKGLPKQVFDDFDHLKLGEGLSGKVALTGESVLLDNLADDPRLTRMMARTEQLRGFASVPLKTRRRIYGTLNVHTHARRQFSRDDVHVLTSIGVQIGYAVESVRLYQDLQASEQKFRNLVERAHDLIFRLDARGRIVYVNPIVSSMLGYTPEEIYASGSTSLDLVHPDDRSRMEARFRAMLAGRVFSGLEYRVVAKESREVRWLSLANYPLLDGDRILGVQAIARDVTERRQLQERVMRAERLADLGRFAAGIVHEVRNPLSAILNAAALLRRDLDLGEEDTRLLNVILEETDRLSKVASDVLTFARSGDPEFQACDLGHLLMDTVRAFQCDERLGQKSRIRLSASADLPSIHTDRNQLRQVVWNILKNAVEASARAGEVLISARPAASADGVVIEIADEGCGMTPEMLARAFEPFATNKPDGTGLGLAIVHGIVERHGGATRIASELGKGTRFTVELPLRHECQSALLGEEGIHTTAVGSRTRI
jgi:PAS domain S-box-containing protein